MLLVPAHCHVTINLSQKRVTKKATKKNFSLLETTTLHIFANPTTKMEKKGLVLSIVIGVLVVAGTAFVPQRNNNRQVRQQSTVGDTEKVSAADRPYSRTAEIVGEKCEAGGTILDESSMIEKQGFPISSEKLLDLAKEALRKDSGVLKTDMWADDFEFCAPYIGPLSKEAFLDAASGFGIYDSFPDFDNRYFGFCVDPLEPGRVWFFTRLMASNTGGLFGKKPNNRTVELPPQVFSFKFNREGLIRELTVGYSVDRRQGDTGGLGGMFGLFYGVGQGLPFPEGKPYKLSRRFRFFNALGSVISKLTKSKNKE